MKFELQGNLTHWISYRMALLASSETWFQKMHRTGLNTCKSV